MRELNVLHLLPRFMGGGVARVVCDLVAGLRDRHIQSVVACAGGDWTSRLDEVGCPWEWAPLYPSTLLNVPRSVVSLRRIVRKHHIDIIHSHHRFSSFVGRIAAGLFGLPFTSSVHDLAAGKHFLTRAGISSRVMVYSPAVARHLVNEFGVSEDGIRYIPMGIPVLKRPVQPEISSFKRRFGFESKDRLVVFAGRLDFEKGPDLFLKAVPAVLAAVPNARFCLAGDGEMRETLLNLARTLAIEQRVRFIGWQRDMDVVIGSADVVVVPSRREGFGRIVAESMVLGKPVVAARTGGLSELIQHEENGILVPVEQADAIADAVIALFENPERTLALVSAGMAAREKYSLETMAGETCKVYYEEIAAS